MATRKEVDELLAIHNDILERELVLITRDIFISDTDKRHIRRGINDLRAKKEEKIKRITGEIPPRSYNDPIPDFAEIYTLQQWREMVGRGSIISTDGTGYWVKDNKQNRSTEVFETEAEDATHVAWYNK